MRIQIETIPHDKQRYETVGDWFYDSNGVLHIKVSQMSDERYAALVAVHELIEVLLCKQHGVTQEQVDKFDINFEKECAFCEASKHEFEGADEPGDDPASPYKNEHCVAMGIERILAAGLGVDWGDVRKGVVQTMNAAEKTEDVGDFEVTIENRTNASYIFGTDTASMTFSPTDLLVTYKDGTQVKYAWSSVKRVIIVPQHSI